MKNKRIECKSLGICTQCHKEKAKKGRVKCEKCTKRTSKAGGISKINYDFPKIKDDISGKIINNWEIISFSHQLRHFTPKGVGMGGTYHWNVKCINCEHKSTKTTNHIRKSNSCSKCRLKPRGETGFNLLYAIYKCAAKSNKREFNLTKDQFKDITSSICFYCGSLPKLTMKSNKFTSKETKSDWGTYKYNGIDRVNNTQGYNYKNCVPCCLICNRAKNEMDFKEFIEYLNNLAKYRLCSKCGEIDRVVSSNFEVEEEPEKSE